MIRKGCELTGREMERSSTGGVDPEKTRTYWRSMGIEMICLVLNGFRDGKAGIDRNGMGKARI